MTMKNTLTVGLGKFSVALALVAFVAAPAMAESEAGMFIFGGGSESGGFSPVGTGGSSESGGYYQNGASSQSGGPTMSGAESESGGMAEVGSSSESGGIYDTGASSEASTFNPQFGIKYYHW